jgi:chaperonin cofactor prefoldin
MLYLIYSTYGLAVLEEKQQLQQQIEELETQYETLKQELETAKEVKSLIIL